MANSLVAQFFLTFAIVALLFNSCHCFNPKHRNISKIQSTNGFAPAGATFYGDPYGAGSDGGACGYQKAVEHPPFLAKVSAGGPSLYQGGKGCGACFQVRCTSSPLCSGNPVTVVITDSCPGGPCASDSVHFDLSGTAFNALAKAGKEAALRTVGRLPIEYTRTPCIYGGQTIVFGVDAGSNANYISTLILYANGDGDFSKVELKQANSNAWVAMQPAWGANWRFNSGSPLQAPLTIRLTALQTGKVVVANNVIPSGWLPGKYYKSGVNF